MKVCIGETESLSWKQKMNIDHDLEIVCPWLYSTYLIDDNIRVSYTPGEKCAIYKIDFPAKTKKNILIQGSSEMESNITGSNSFTFEEAINYTTRGIFSETRKMKAYISLYRTYERMVDINEYGKYYSGYDGKIHESDRPFYVDDWIWDTYRATHPLRTILNPELQNNVLNSYALMYEQSGWMPTFPQVHGNHMCMNSYHSASIFIDGYRKGLRDYNINKAYEGIEKNLMEGTFIPWRQGTPRRSIDDFYHEHGYFPALHPGEKEREPQMDDFEKRQSVAVTLGISYDFWCLAELSKELGKSEEYRRNNLRSFNYQNLWRPDYLLFMPKDDKGNWIEIDPKKDGGKGYREYYDENNGWTYAWNVPHDIKGLTKLLGGKKAAEARLDQLFREPLDIYIQKAFLNNEEIFSPFITHQQIMNGGILELILDELPNKEWGKNAKVPEI